MRARSALELIAAHGGSYTPHPRGAPPAVRPGAQKPGERHEPPPPRGPCRYLGEFLRAAKVQCGSPAVPQHECLHPDRTARPSHREPAKLIPPTALLGDCAHFDGRQSQPCGLCRLWEA